MKKPTLDDLTEINTETRNRELDSEILKPAIEIAGLSLRPISAGDLAMLMEAGIGLVVGKTTSVAFDVGAILWAQSQPRDQVRRLCANGGEFRARVYEFLDEYEAGVFNEATPLVLELVNTMNKARTSLKGEIEGQAGEAIPKKVGGRRG
jgi:hypothetical protein